MSLTITLPSEIEERLQEEAERRGLSVAVYVERLLKEYLLPGEVGIRRRYWRDLRASAPTSLLREDAQAWVTRTRRDSDVQRDGLIEEQG
jgi:hypothetical protein